MMVLQLLNLVFQKQQSQQTPFRKTNYPLTNFVTTIKQNYKNSKFKGLEPCQFLILIYSIASYRTQ